MGVEVWGVSEFEKRDFLHLSFCTSWVLILSQCEPWAWIFNPEMVVEIYFGKSD